MLYSTIVHTVTMVIIRKLRLLWGGLLRLEVAKACCERFWSGTKWYRTKGQVQKQPYCSSSQPQIQTDYKEPATMNKKEPMSLTEASTTKRLLSALFYASTSILIMIVNKSVLTNYRFPSAQFLGLGQMVAGITLLSLGKCLGILSFPKLSVHVSRKIFPLPLLYFGNLVCGLGGTKQISLPMFTALRRFTILITMILEMFIFGNRPSTSVVLTVVSMVVGAIIAASNDLAFHLVGYIYILSNDFLTAGYNVVMKKQLNANELGKYGIIFYNSVFMIIPSIMLAYATGDLERAFHYPNWTDYFFVFEFLLSCVMGFILIFSVTLCTAYNSALTTTVVGCVKNVAITYIGMFFGGDYVFSWENFIGINISVIGGIVYSYIAFVNKNKPTTEQSPNRTATAV